MSLLKLLFKKKEDINDGVMRFREEPDAVLIDVRTEEEYLSGHIEGSINIPVDVLADLKNLLPEKGTHIYLYCRSGNRSARAETILKDQGYNKAQSIGGITSYRGKIVK